MFTPNSPKLPKRVRALSKIIGIPNTLDLLDAIGTYKQIGAGASGKVYALKNKGKTFVVKTGSVPAREKRISNYLSNKTDVVPAQYGNGKQYQIMEKLEGVPLQKCLSPDKNKALLEQIFPNVEFNRATQSKITKRIIRAYSVIHKLGIAHSDIHTGNIFVTAPDLKIKIIDFGLSQEGFRYVLEEILYGPSPDEANLDYSYINGIVSDSAFAENISNVSELFPKTITEIFKKELHKFWIENICKPLDIDFELIRSQVNNGVDIIDEIYENPDSEFKKIDNFLKDITDEEGLRLVNKFYDSLLNALGSDDGNVTAKSNVLKKFAKGGIVSSPTLSLVGENNKTEFIFKTKQIGINETNLDNILDSNYTKQKPKTYNIQDVQDYSNLYKKFINKVDKFFTSTNKILNLFSRNTLKLVEIKNRLYETEKNDKQISSRETKKINEQLKDSQKTKKQRKELDLDKNAGYLALLLGLGTLGGYAGGDGGYEVYGDVVKEGEFGVDRTGELTHESPAWIPFPKGTKGLVFTSGFGYQNWRGYEHGGVDIAGPVGTPIITPISGIVRNAEYQEDGYGYAVVVESGNLKMLFGHMYAQPNVKVGQNVVAGTKIGGIGSTGRSTGPHLHWTIYVDNKKVNPVTWTRNNPSAVALPTFQNTGGFGRYAEPTNQKAEGGLNVVGNILVGEGGDEIVVPLSQMKIFMAGMIDEKLKSMLPFYQGTKIDGDYGVPGISEIANRRYASGALVMAESMISHHEALGAYIPNTGGPGRLPDFINIAEGGTVSTLSSTPKDKAFDKKTNLFAYADSENVPTIGFGTTFIGKLYGAKEQSQPVNMGTQMTVGRAYDIMRKHIKEIDDRHTKDFPLWKYIPDKAKSGIISYLYNRGPYIFYNQTDPLRLYLLKGDMPGIASIVRTDTVSVGPKRREMEADAIKTGGIVKAPKPGDKDKPQNKSTPQSKPKPKLPLVTKDCKRGRRPENLWEAIQQGYLVGICESKRTFKKDKDKIFKRASKETSSSELNTVAYDMHNSIIEFSNNFNFDKKISEETTIYYVQDTIKGEIA